MKGAIGTAVLTALLLVCLIGEDGVDCGEACRRKDLNGNDELFECPRLFESSKKRFCCGQTPSEKYCCAWSKKSREFVNNPDSVKYLFEGAVSIIIMVLLLIGGLIICCCLCACCLLQRKHKRRGRVLSKWSLVVTSGQPCSQPVDSPVFASLQARATTRPVWRRWRRRPTAWPTRCSPTLTRCRAWPRPTRLTPTSSRRPTPSIILSRLTTRRSQSSDVTSGHEIAHCLAFASMVSILSICIWFTTAFWSLTSSQPFCASLRWRTPMTSTSCTYFWRVFRFVFLQRSQYSAESQIVWHLCKISTESLNYWLY